MGVGVCQEFLTTTTDGLQHTKMGCRGKLSPMVEAVMTWYARAEPASAGSYTCWNIINQQPRHFVNIFKTFPPTGSQQCKSKRQYVHNSEHSASTHSAFSLTTLRPDPYVQRAQPLCSPPMSIKIPYKFWVVGNLTQ